MNIKEFRKGVKALGYRVLVKRYSWGPHAVFLHGKIEMPTVFAFVRSDRAMHEWHTLEFWVPLLDYIDRVIAEHGDVYTDDGERIYGITGRGRN